MALIKKTAQETKTAPVVEKEQAVETVNEAVVEKEQAVEKETVKEQVAETEKEVVADKVEEAKTEVETENLVADQEVEKESIVEEQTKAVEKETVVQEDVQEQQAETDVVETQAKEQVVETKTEVAVAEKQASTEVAAKPAANVSTAGVVESAADEGFEGIELGFGSFPIITLPSEGIFNDSDDNELGKHVRAVLQQSKESFLFRQEDQNDGPVGFSYDGINLSSYTGEDDFKTVEEMRASWSEEGYEMEKKKYLEVIAVVCEDHDEILSGEVPDGLEDLEGEPVIFRVPPSSVKAFSGKVATLNMSKKPVKGALMDFMVGKKRGEGANKYFPWKFRLVK